MQVKLLAYTPDPEKTVACAAKLCYAAADIETVYEGLTEEKTASPLEFKGCPGRCWPRLPGIESHPSVCRASAT